MQTLAAVTIAEGWSPLWHEGRAGILSFCTAAKRQDEDPSPHSLHSPAENRLPWALKEVELLWRKKKKNYICVRSCS